MAIIFGLAPSVFVPLTLYWTPRASVWPALLLYHGYLALIPRLSKSALPPWTTRTWRQWMVPAVAVSGLTLIAAYWAAPLVEGKIDFLVSPLLGLLEPWGAFVAYSLAINPFVEEYFWRGYVLNKCGVWLSSTFFWLAHLTGLFVLVPWKWALPLSLGPLVAAVAWAFWCKKAKSIWPCVMTHWACDAAILWMVAEVRAI